MSRELTVLLVEDDPDECEKISMYADSAEDINLIGITNSSTKALEYVKDYLPDAVILDLELHQGSGNGLIFLKELHELSFSKIPYILVTTNNMSQITHEQVRAMGADFIMTKYQQDYSVNSVMDFLRIMQSSIQHPNTLSKSSHQETPPEVAPPCNVGIMNRINRELDLIGISPKAVGRKYLIDAIQLIMMNQRSHICSQLANKYAKSDASIERAMQNAINHAWRTSSIDDLSYYYTARITAEKGVPTLTEFIYYYARKISLDYQKK